MAELQYISPLTFDTIRIGLVEKASTISLIQMDAQRSKGRHPHRRHTGK